MTMIDPRAALCPICKKSEVLCCSTCGRCSEHSHARCNAVRVSLRGLADGLKGGFEAAVAEEGPDDDDGGERAALRAGFEMALSYIEDAAAEGAVMAAPNHAPTALLLTYLDECARADAPRLRAAGKLSAAPEGGFEAQCDEKDYVGWAKSFFTWWRRVVDKHPFVPPQEQPTRIPNDARIAILGDWGSGLYGAPVCAASIQSAARPYDVLLHLGDVYYSGLKSEVEERFLALWPDVPNAVSRATNSNHEMYAGGHGYFGLTLPAFGQSSSCFALENDHFVLIGLDTGYDEHDLTDEQVPWVERLVTRANAEGKKVVLLSHHQPFSQLEKQGDKLIDKLRPWLEGGRIFAWYWGHEHRCALFDVHPRWQMYGRLVGHSGFPAFRDELGAHPIERRNEDGSVWHRMAAKPETPSALILDGPNRYVPGESDRYGANGYMSLTLEGGVIRERVHSPEGQVLLETAIGTG